MGIKLTELGVIKELRASLPFYSKTEVNYPLWEIIIILASLVLASLAFLFYRKHKAKQRLKVVLPKITEAHSGKAAVKVEEPIRLQKEAQSISKPAEKEDVLVMKPESIIAYEQIKGQVNKKPASEISSKVGKRKQTKKQRKERGKKRFRGASEGLYFNIFQKNKKNKKVA